MSALVRRLQRYASTARHLTLRQWIYFPLRRLQERRPLRLPPGHPADATFAPNANVAAAVAALGPRWPDPVARADAVLAGTFEFVGRTARRPDIDWTGQHVSRLWTYNLHYFDFGHDLAWAWHATRDPRYPAAFTAMALEWIDATAGDRGPGWEPYTASVRIVNWTHALLLFGGGIPQVEQRRIAESLHRQLRWLERRIEWHILANHLQRNLQALAFGAAVFAGADARRWRERFAPLLWKQLLEQVLPDGGHFERSPMYHAIALGDFLETIAICRAAGIAIPHEVLLRVRAMVGALDVVARPDGSLHLFNDSAEGIAPAVASLRRFADALGLAPMRPEGAALPRTGYFLFDDRAGTRLVVDCGDPGPSYQPGHTHCDLLSFELDLAGRPVVVDSGVHGYDGDPYREYVRSTRAHNTVAIDGRDQYEVWGTFRVARRAHVVSTAVERRDPWTFTGVYRPYHDSRAEHARQVVCEPEAIRVTDTIRGAAGVPLDSYVHLHPDFVAVLDGDAVIATAGTLKVRIDPFGACMVTLHRGEKDPVQGWHCPRFGTALESPVIRLHVAANRGGAFGYRITRVTV